MRHPFLSAGSHEPIPPFSAVRQDDELARPSMARRLIAPALILLILCGAIPAARAMALEPDVATITPTANPLVALYNAPPCDSGLVAIVFHPLSGAAWTSWRFTSGQPCQPGQGETIPVAGLEPNTTYEMQHLIVGRAGLSLSRPQLFTTGALPPTLAFPAVTVPTPSQPGAASRADLVIHMRAFTPPNVPNPLVTDLAGHVVWYYDPSTSGRSAIWPVRFLPGGTVLLFDRTGLTPYPNNDDEVREIDLAGATLRQTNLTAVNAQLPPGDRPLLGFHHDAVRLPNSDTAVIGYDESCVNPTTNALTPPPCASTDRDVVGDKIVVLDPSFQKVVWSWDTFAHLDVNRKAILGETCSSVNPARFCPVVNQNAEDWTHSNGLDYTPADGNLILSVRHQDWVIKINYADGAGDGGVVWRLGKDGDFTINSPDPTNSTDLWFSHQHNPHFLDATTLTLFDNGNTRCTDPSTGQYIAGCNSRGQALTLDEANRTATLTVNANLGVYSQAQGSAERLPTGSYVFGAGTLELPPSFSQSIETPPTTSDQAVAPQLYVQQLGAIEYRSYRVGDLYHGTDTPCLGLRCLGLLLRAARP